jgi:transposase
MPGRRLPSGRQLSLRCIPSRLAPFFLLALPLHQRIRPVRVALWSFEMYESCDSKTAIEVITSGQRRRRWSAEEKERLVAASMEPGAGVFAVARQAGVHPSQLYGWRRQLCARPQPVSDFAPVRISADPTPSAIASAGKIEIELANGSRVRITGRADPSLVMAMIRSVAKARRRR